MLIHFLSIVLILVLVEDGLREFPQEPKYTLRVLILVLVEDGLRVVQEVSQDGGQTCLNPCSCGGWSQSDSLTCFFIIVEKS